MKILNHFKNGKRINGSANGQWKSHGNIQTQANWNKADIKKTEKIVKAMWVSVLHSSSWNYMKMTNRMLKTVKTMSKLNTLNMVKTTLQSKMTK